MNIGVTGSHGYIGGHVLAYLEGLGYCVQGLDRSVFNTHEFDCDTVINCAWPRIGDIQSLEHIDFARTTIQMLEAAKSQGIRVINTSSHNEYGCKFEPAKETDICQPIDTYGLAKLMVTLHAQKLGFNSLRLYAVFGDGGRTFMDIYDKETAKYSQPENVKDFVSIETVCHAFERMLHAQHLYGEVINICSGKQESAEEIAAEVAGAEQKWYTYKQRQYEPSMWEGDPTKMQRLLNLKP